jgi:PTS system nitrogen regulatory IIA component
MYLNLIQLAESFGVSEKVVEGWIRDEGLPHTPDRRVLLFDRAQVAQWAATRGLAAKAGFLAAENPALTAALRLAPLLHNGGIWRGVAAAGLLEVFVRVASALPGATPPVRGLLEQRLRAAGGVTYAPVGFGFALPHPATRITLGRDSGTLALILLDDRLALAEPQVDEVPVTRLFFFIAPSPRAHLDMVGRLSRLLLRPALRDALAGGAGDEEIFQVVAAADAAVPEVRKQEGKVE